MEKKIKSTAEVIHTIFSATFMAYRIRVFHPVDAVQVPQVRVPLLVKVTGVRRLVRVGSSGGVH